MVYFISGIDTDIGKTCAVGALARDLLRRQVKVITQKLVQTGNTGFSEDIAKHREIMRTGLLPEDEAGLTCPYTFKFPCSPHLAAELEGKTIDPEVIGRATAALAANYDTVLLEGAGGLAVPLSDRLLTIDYVKSRGYPVILVTSGRLGSISHTVLAIEALRHRGMTLRGLLFNLTPAADPVIAVDARRMMLGALRQHGFPEVLIDLPKIEPDGETPDFGPLFEERGSP